MRVKIFKCGLCNSYSGTRRGLREHIIEEHRIVKNLANIPTAGHKRIFNPNKPERSTQNWRITEEIK